MAIDSSGLPVPNSKPVKKGYAISLLTYRKMGRFLDFSIGRVTQAALVRNAVGALKTSPNGLRMITPHKRGEEALPDTQLLVNAFDEETVQTVEELARKYDLFKGQVVDNAILNYLGTQSSAGRDIEIPGHLIRIQNWRVMPRGKKLPVNSRSLEALREGQIVFVDASILFAGITSTFGDAAQSSQCSKFIHACLAAQHRGFTTGYELGRLEQLLRTFAGDGSSETQSKWLAAIVNCISVVEVTHEEIRADDTHVSTLAARAALVAM